MTISTIIIALIIYDLLKVAVRVILAVSLGTLQHLLR
jgi:hypothetical protein